MGQMRWVRSMANPLVQWVFASIIGKIRVPQNKLPLPAPKNPNVSLFTCLLSLFQVATPPLLLGAIRRLGYDRRGWLYETLTAWVVVPVDYFWRPQFDLNWARSPFLPRATCYARPALPAGIPCRGHAGRVLSHPPAAERVGPTWRRRVREVRLMTVPDKSVPVMPNG